MNPTLFRLLVITAISLPVAGGLADLAFPNLISPGLLQAMEAEPTPDTLTSATGWALIGAWALACIVGVVGLLFFRSWARTLTLWITVLGFAIYPLLGSSVYSWLSLALTETGAIVWGAMLAFSYTEPIKSHFRPREHDA
jgi:hypothetical protein